MIATAEPEVSPAEIVREQPQTTAPLAPSPRAFEVERVAEAAPVIERAPAPQPEPVAQPEPAGPRAIEPLAPRAIEAQAPPAAEPQAPAPQPAPLKLDWPSDLVQIETDPHKAREVVVEEAPVAPRVRRVRPAPAPVVNEPLVQVETHNRESV